MGNKFWIVGTLIVLIILAGCTSETVSHVQLTRQEAFEGYRKAIEERDLENFKRYVSSDMISQMEADLGGKLTQEQFNQAAAIIDAFTTPLEDVVVEEETAEGDSATWIVSDKGDSQTTGSVKFIKEADGWKVLKEKWVSGTY